MSQALWMAVAHIPRLSIHFGKTDRLIWTWRINSLCTRSIVLQLWEGQDGELVPSMAV